MRSIRVFAQSEYSFYPDFWCEFGFVRPERLDNRLFSPAKLSVARLWAIYRPIVICEVSQCAISMILPLIHRWIDYANVKNVRCVYFIIIDDKPYCIDMSHTPPSKMTHDYALRIHKLRTQPACLIL